MSDDEKSEIAALNVMVRTLISRQGTVLGEIAEIKKQLAPIYLHHQIITVGGKWMVGLLVSIWGLFEAFIKLREHFTFK